MRPATVWAVPPPSRAAHVDVRLHRQLICIKYRITSLSMDAHAPAVSDRAEAEKVLRMLPLKYPEYSDMRTLPMPMPSTDEVRIFRVVPTVISVLDYSLGFGHTDLCTCESPPISE